MNGLRARWKKRARTYQPPSARSAEYERRIREAKAAMYAAQEVRRRKELEARVTAITEARKAALARARRVRVRRSTAS